MNRRVAIRPDASPSSLSIPEVASPRPRIFLLSPANASGVKGQRLLDPLAQSDLGRRLRHSGVPLAELYGFISSLYFRGKLEYAQKFSNPPCGVDGVQIITGAGLMLPERMVNFPEFQKISATAIDADNSEYRLPLDRDLLRLHQRVGCDADIILLGSIATRKYIAPIEAVFGHRLLFPRNFVGIGDMSRGSILLKCCAQELELEYLPAAMLMDLK
jgi:hypothetical protein